MTTCIDLRLRQHTDQKTNSLIVIREWCNESMIHSQLEPQSGFRLLVQPRYTVKIYPHDSKNLLKSYKQLELTMEECYEQFPWFFDEA